MSSAKLSPTGHPSIVTAWPYTDFTEALSNRLVSEYLVKPEVARSIVSGKVMITRQSSLRGTGLWKRKENELSSSTTEELETETTAEVMEALSVIPEI